MLSYRPGVLIENFFPVDQYNLLEKCFPSRGLSVPELLEGKVFKLSESFSRQFSDFLRHNKPWSAFYRAVKNVAHGEQFISYLGVNAKTARVTVEFVWLPADGGYLNQPEWPANRAATLFLFFPSEYWKPEFGGELDVDGVSFPYLPNHGVLIAGCPYSIRPCKGTEYVYHRTLQVHFLGSTQ